MATHLTERIVKAAEIGTRKYVVFDEDCAGFGLCVFLSGRKGFILIYRAAGRQRRMTIGTWPSWSVVASRDEAKRLKRDIDRGEDPMDVRTSIGSSPRSMSRFSRLASSRAAATDQLGHVPIVMRRCRPAAR